MTQRILAARFAIVSREQFDPCRTVSVDMLPVSAIGLRMVAAANLVEVALSWVTLRERRCLTPLWAASRRRPLSLLTDGYLERASVFGSAGRTIGEDRPRYRID